MVVYLQEQEIPGFVAFSIKQLDELADYCKFQKLTIENSRQDNFGQSSITVALIQKLQYLQMSSIERQLLHAHIHYRNSLCVIELALARFQEGGEEMMRGYHAFLRDMRAVLRIPDTNEGQ